MLGWLSLCFLLAIVSATVLPVSCEAVLWTKTSFPREIQVAATHPLCQSSVRAQVVFLHVIRTDRPLIQTAQGCYYRISYPPISDSTGLAITTIPTYLNTTTFYLGKRNMIGLLTNHDSTGCMIRELDLMALSFFPQRARIWVEPVFYPAVVPLINNTMAVLMMGPPPPVRSTVCRQTKAFLPGFSLTYRPRVQVKIPSRHLTPDQIPLTFSRLDTRLANMFIYIIGSILFLLFLRLIQRR